MKRIRQIIKALNMPGVKFNPNSSPDITCALLDFQIKKYKQAKEEK